MGKTWALPIVIIAASLVAVAFFGLSSDKTGSEKSKQANSIPIVSGFLPATLCKDTGGSWEEVLPSEYPVNEDEGVYNPTTNPGIGYKCFCKENKTWSKEGGCS